MEIKLYEVKCEDCEFETLTTSNEYMSCPNCGENSLKWSNDTITAETNDVFKSEIENLVEDEADILAMILIANSYVTGDKVIATYEDLGRFELNFKESTFTDEIVKMLRLESINELESKIYKGIPDIHSSLIYDPIFCFIERDSCTDEYDNLFEKGYVKPSTAKKIYEWLKENRNYIASYLKK